MQKKNILLLEDDRLSITNIKKQIENLNIDHTIQVAHDGVEGINILTEGDEKTRFIPDLILLDINMPKMNGIEFLRIIRSYYSLKDIKTFIISGSADEYDILAAENLGVDGFVPKPFDLKSNTSPGSVELLKELLSNQLSC